MFDKTFCWKEFTVFVTRGRKKVIFDAGGHKKVIPSLGAVKKSFGPRTIKKSMEPREDGAGRLVDLVRLYSLLIISRNHSNTFSLLDLQKNRRKVKNRSSDVMIFTCLDRLLFTI